MSTSARVDILSRSETFGGVPRAELALLADMMRVEVFPAGTLVFEAGEPADAIYVVSSGVLSVLVGQPPTPVRQLREGAVLGEYAMFVGHVRTATVRAESECELLSLDYERFHAYLHRFPAATWKLLDVTVRRLVAAESRRGGA